MEHLREIYGCFPEQLILRPKTSDMTAIQASQTRVVRYALGPSKQQWGHGPQIKVLGGGGSTWNQEGS